MPGASICCHARKGWRPGLPCFATSTPTLAKTFHHRTRRGDGSDPHLYGWSRGGWQPGLRPRSARITAPGPHCKAERAVAIEQRGRGARACALDREQAQLRRDPPIGGEPSRLSTGREHAVAGYDDREWVTPERLTHLARQVPGAEPGRDLTVRQGRAGDDRACDLVDAAVE